MKSFDKLIVLLQSNYFSNFTSEDKSLLQELMRLFSTLTYDDIKKLLQPKTDIKRRIETETTFCKEQMTEENNATGSDKTKLDREASLIQFVSHLDLARTRLIDFLSGLVILQDLLLHCMKELQGYVNKYNDHFKKETLLSADKLVDLLVAKLSLYNKTVLERVAANLDTISYFAGISEFASYISNLYVSCMFSLGNISKEETLLDKTTIVIKGLMDKDQIMPDLKMALERYRDFHFDHIISHLKLLYPKAPKFHLEKPYHEIASTELVNVNDDFDKKTASRYGDPLLTFHLRKYFILQDALKLILHPVSLPEMMLVETIELLSCRQDALLKKPPRPETGWFSFFSSPHAALQAKEQLLIKEIYRLVDAYTELSKKCQPN